ncbi:MAG: MFS transporter [Anaerolineae bacterium]
MIDDAAWVVTGYLLAYTISMTFMGRVSDLIGRRRAFIICLIIFMIGSFVVAEVDPKAESGVSSALYSIRVQGVRPDPGSVALLTIIIGRVIQALGAGALVPVSLALVGDLFPAHKRAQPLGVIGAVDTLGWVLGHLYGGIMVRLFGEYSAQFVRLLPVARLELGRSRLARPVLDQHPRVAGRAGGDVVDAARRAAGARQGAGISTSTEHAADRRRADLPRPRSWREHRNQRVDQRVFGYGRAAVCRAGAGGGGGHVRAVHSGRGAGARPLFDLHIFRRRNLSAGLVTNLFVGFCLMIGLVSVPILVNIRLQDTSDLPKAALQVGVLLSRWRKALTVPMALAAVPGGWLSKRIGYRWTATVGLGLAVLGFGAIWQTWTLDVADSVIAVEMALVGVGLGLTFSPISASVINAADRDKLGAASALVIIMRLLGMTISVSLLTAFASQQLALLAAAELGQQVIDPMAAIDVYAADRAGVDRDESVRRGDLRDRLDPGAALRRAAVAEPVVGD